MLPDFSFVKKNTLIHQKHLYNHSGPLISFNYSHVSQSLVPDLSLYFSIVSKKGNNFCGFIFVSLDIPFPKCSPMGENSF